MDGSQYPCFWGDERGPMIVDSFAGGGGASTGIEAALGRSPDVAINHSAAALALHKANHPDTLHLDSNIWDIEPREVTGGRPVGLLWASPDCSHFSKAKGSALRDRNTRDLAWVVVRWAEEVKPDVILLENVEEFRTWGPVDDDGRVIEWLRGHTFETWLKRLKAAGYKVQSKELRGCDYGDPTIRKRLFIVARRDGRRITWPKPTHGAPDSPGVKAGKLQPYRTAADCIDWSIPCPSIFDTRAEIKAKLGLTAKRPLAKNTLARIARGMKRYVLEAEKPFLVNLTHGGRHEVADEPLRTITAAHRGEKAVIAPSVVSVAHGDSGGRREYPLADPLGTVSAGGVQHAVVAPHLMINTTGHTGSAAARPAPTITTGGQHALLAPSITRFNGGATGQDARDPLATVTANSWVKKPGGATPLGMIAPVLTYAQHGGRCRDITEPHHTIAASKKDQNALLAPVLVQTGYGERPGQAPRSLDMHKPLGTVVAAGAKHAPAVAFLAQQNGGPRMATHTGHEMGKPMSTVTGSGSQQTPVAAWMAKYYGTDQDPRLAEPLHTVTTKDRFGHMQAELTVPPFSAEHADRAREVAEFLRAHDAWDGGEFVTLEIDGEQFIVVDIGMRMLTPRELFRAQGFPDDYVIEGVWRQDGDDWIWQPFSKDVQISCCGNSVCPGVAEALAAANCAHLAAKEAAA